MNIFDEWFDDENRQLDEGYWSPIREGGKWALDAAFRAGMLAAADIAKDCYSGYEALSIEWAIREEAKE